MPGIAPEWSSVDVALDDLAEDPEMTAAVEAAREALRSVDPAAAIETTLSMFSGSVRDRLEYLLRRH